MKPSRRAPRASSLGLALLALLLLPIEARAQAKTARLTIASDPPDAVVSLTAKDRKPAAPKGKAEALDRVLGRTPLTVEVPAGPAEVVIARDGYVLEVEPLELEAGAAQRLEVRLAKDVPVPCGISFKDASGLVKSSAEAEQLVDMVVQDVFALYVEEKDPRALLDSATRTLVQALSAVRERESLLRRELGEAERVRFYGEEVDLRAYPELAYSEHGAESGRVRWSLAAGTLAVEGVTDPRDYETFRQKLHAIYAFIKNRWDLAKRLDDGMLARALVEGLLGSLDDVHTHFLPPDAFKEMGDETNGHFGGIGLVVGSREGGAITVVAPMAGTPGEKAGLLAGDRIVAIDGRSTEGMVVSEVIKLMRGDPDTPIELTIRRGEAAPFKVALRRASIAIKNTRAALLAPEATPGPGAGPAAPIGYLRIASFMADKLAEEVARALDDLEAKGARALVIDLRNNPGGLLQQAVQIADTLVPDGVIVSTRGRLPLATRTFEASPVPKRKRIPIAILVNDGSASASEILAGTLREHKLAFLVGQKTFGKGSVQRVIPLDPFGCALALTVATYHLPSGMTPHKRGLEPDIAVTMTEDEKLLVAAESVYSEPTAATDPQLRAAIAELGNRLRGR
jgi:carboxyl-terminal processing protease